jgi:sarcosine oxidase delta subunit
MSVQMYKHHYTLHARRGRPYLQWCALALVLATATLFYSDVVTWQPSLEFNPNVILNTTPKSTTQPQNIAPHNIPIQETAPKTTAHQRPGKHARSQAPHEVWFRDTTDNAAATQRALDNREDVRKFASYIYKHQHPTKCSPSRVWTWTHHAGIGSVFQVWKNTLLKALNDNMVLASGFESEYVNPLHCPSRRPENCLVFPISNCVAGNVTNTTIVRTELLVKGTAAYEQSRQNHINRVNPLNKTERIIITDMSTGFIQVHHKSCVIPKRKLLYKRAKLSRPRSNQWYHAQVMRYILRTRPIVDVYKAAVSQALNLPAMSQLLAVHIRHGDVGLDGRRPIPTTHYAHVAVQQVTWAGFTGILVGSDNRRAARELRLLVHDDPVLQRVCPSVPVHPFPDDLFELSNDGGKAAAALHLKRTQDEEHKRHTRLGERRQQNDVGQANDYSAKESSNVSPTVAEYVHNHRADVERIFAHANEPITRLEAVIQKNEGAAILAQLMLMSEAGGFIGTINSNYARTVYDLVLARTASGDGEERSSLYDMEGRPYFGCLWRKRMPMGGGREMYPFDSDQIN